MIAGRQHRGRRDPVGHRRHATATGHLVNGTFALPQPLQVRAANAANPTTGATRRAERDRRRAVSLLLYTAPTAGADPVTHRLPSGDRRHRRPARGTYSKTLTFTLSTTTP